MIVEVLDYFSLTHLLIFLLSPILLQLVQGWHPSKFVSPRSSQEVFKQSDYTSTSIFSRTLHMCNSPGNSDPGWEVMESPCHVAFPKTMRIIMCDFKGTRGVPAQLRTTRQLLPGQTMSCLQWTDTIRTRIVSLSMLAQCSDSTKSPFKNSTDHLGMECTRPLKVSSISFCSNLYYSSCSAGSDQASLCSPYSSMSLRHP